MVILIVTIVLIGLTQSESIEPLTNININNGINKLSSTLQDGENCDSPSLYPMEASFSPLIESGQLIKPESYQINRTLDLPDYFDSRTFWSDCDSIKTVNDQGNCGSCWAINAVSSMSDRLCIKSNGSINVQLSSEEVISCCSYCGVGCRNGYAVMAFKYWIEHGIVTGGPFQGNGCLPYSISPCKHHDNGSRSSCEELGLSVTPSCSHECVSNSGKNFISDKHFGEKYYSFYETFEIMSDIMTNGPVVARMVIYEDLYNYKSGIYQHETGARLGYHTVKLIGWGNDFGVDYWLATNSWNTDWGDNGFFKIRRGENECEIESDVIAGLPKL